jgi:hypothetical protein
MDTQCEELSIIISRAQDRAFDLSQKVKESDTRDLVMQLKTDLIAVDNIFKAVVQRLNKLEQNEANADQGRESPVICSPLNDT